MRIIVIPEVYDFLERLVIILYEKEYFGYEEAARKYVEELYQDITGNLSTCVKKSAPKYFDKYGKGMYYAIFKKANIRHGRLFQDIRKKRRDNLPNTIHCK